MLQLQLIHPRYRYRYRYRYRHRYRYRSRYRYRYRYRYRPQPEDCNSATYSDDGALLPCGELANSSMDCTTLKQRHKSIFE